MAYLRGHYEPSDEAEEKRLSQRARGYVISQGELHKLGVVTPWLKCIPVAQGIELLNEIHSGICGSHIGTRPLAAKAFMQYFFWPSALKDAEKVVKDVRSLSKVGPKIQQTFGTLTTDSPCLASPKLGNGRRRPTAYCPRKLQIRSGCHRVLYQMGRG